MPKDKPTGKDYDENFKKEQEKKAQDLLQQKKDREARKKRLGKYWI